MRHKPTFVMCAALLMISAGFPTAVNGQDQAYELVPDWPTFPSGVFFGAVDGWPDQAMRDQAAAARRRAREALANSPGQPAQAPSEPLSLWPGRVGHCDR